MHAQVLVDTILNRLPITAMTFTFLRQGGSVFKIGYYVN